MCYLRGEWDTTHHLVSSLFSYVQQKQGAWLSAGHKYLMMVDSSVVSYIPSLDKWVWYTSSLGLHVLLSVLSILHNESAAEAC